MPKIIDYAISRSTDIHLLTSEVARLISEGWQPLGSLTSSPCFIDSTGDLPTNPGNQNLLSRVMYAQAMVKNAEDLVG